MQRKRRTAFGVYVCVCVCLCVSLCVCMWEERAERRRETKGEEIAHRSVTDHLSPSRSLSLSQSKREASLETQTHTHTHTHAHTHAHTRTHTLTHTDTLKGFLATQRTFCSPPFRNPVFSSPPLSPLSFAALLKAQPYSPLTRTLLHTPLSTHLCSRNKERKARVSRGRCSFRRLTHVAADPTPTPSTISTLLLLRLTTQRATAHGC